MNYIGDFPLGATFDLKFTTRTFSTGAPGTMSSGAVAAYVDNSATEITAGITLTADFDSRTGLNHLRVVASGGNGFASGSNYQLVLTAGTVGGVSVVGEVIAHFSIDNAVLPSTERTAIADALLDRNMATGTDSGSASVRTVRQALRFLRNLWLISGTTLSVKKEDDATESWNAQITSTPGASPITGSDPS